ncbi:hypothetical protein [Nocardioides piscis]|uniref:Uncharacterized protein n=1 Tax=Nocardioides piscis TaxID=2714938 RepID=A0A6G7YBB8_9ACTN|nr:hypothetical protein [Nocardioides piscis]QIK74060.1 hypothetical protein G7071_12530 [Nocardioides piscis]
MRDQFDVDLEDTDLLGEVELTTALMIAATESVERLSCAEIDDLLGVTAKGDDDGGLADGRAGGVRTAQQSLERVDEVGERTADSRAGVAT